MSHEETTRSFDLETQYCGHGGCRAPEAPVPIWLPGLAPAPQVFRQLLWQLENDLAPEVVTVH